MKELARAGDLEERAEEDEDEDEGWRRPPAGCRRSPLAPSVIWLASRSSE